MPTALSGWLFFLRSQIVHVLSLPYLLTVRSLSLSLISSTLQRVVSLISSTLHRTGGWQLHGGRQELARWLCAQFSPLSPQLSTEPAAGSSMAGCRVCAVVALARCLPRTLKSAVHPQHRLRRRRSRASASSSTATRSELLG
uniref:Uncharacterized protein n=1 Tax=Arundo donax TaxID=35708 RepID=A0A0A9HIU2_ARUDO